MLGPDTGKSKKYTIHVGSVGPDYAVFHGCIIQRVDGPVIYFKTVDNLERAACGTWEFEEEK